MTSLWMGPDRWSWERSRRESPRLRSRMVAPRRHRAEHSPLLAGRRRCRPDCLPTEPAPVQPSWISGQGVQRQAPVRAWARGRAGRRCRWRLAPRGTDSARRWPRRRCGRVSAGRDAWDVDVRSCHFDEKMVVGPPARPHRADLLAAEDCWWCTGLRCATSRRYARSEPLCVQTGTRSADSTRCGGIDATRRFALPCAAGSADCSRGAGNHGAAARRFSWPVNRSSANRAATPFVSGRADDVAVVPADAYEYRHERKLAQPWSCTVC